ncbi:MAG: hypothetical protein A2V98_14555 [Planctomycetes bacterium RBG_16_64_12]|nr:MAG: hypothetical protein A2V98_14555 [Planctomycetes bacterium RBG_16_64_12]
MLDIHGRQAGWSHPGVNRRDFMRVGALGVGGLTLADWLKLKAHGQAQEGKAKSVIQLFMLGGPTHLDTWDPKPEAGEDYCGPLKSPIETNVPGIRISELLPLTAKQADKFSIIRSYTHQDFGHETAAYTVATGALPAGEMVYPSMGAVTSLKKGYDAGYQGGLPPYITLTTPLPWFSDTGFLDTKYQTFATFGDPNDNGFRVQGLAMAGGLTDQRLEERRTLLQSVDTLAKEMDQEPAFQEIDGFHQRAYSMVLGDAKKAFDMSQETDEVRNKYGRNYFGQCCLLARRLVEQGVPFITINWGWWDTHVDNFGAMKANLPVFDQGFSGLFEDLAQRGLLESTIVLWCGEFGRTPKVDWTPPWNGGRHHYPLCYSTVVGGGGFRGGTVVGSSDDKGEYPKQRPVYPWDLTSSIYKLLGINPTDRLPHPQGCVAYVTPLSKGDRPTGGLLHEIM